MSVEDQDKRVENHFVLLFVLHACSLYTESLDKRYWLWQLNGVQFFDINDQNYHFYFFKLGSGH